MGALEDYRDMIAGLNPGPRMADAGWASDHAQAYQQFKNDYLYRTLSKTQVAKQHVCWDGCFLCWHINEEDYRAGQNTWFRQKEKA